jgi:hypothetical protein
MIPYLGIFILLTGLNSAQHPTAMTFVHDSAYFLVDSRIAGADTVEIRVYKSFASCSGLLNGFFIIQHTSSGDVSKWAVLWGKGEDDYCGTDVFSEVLDSTHRIILTLFTDEDNIWGAVHLIQGINTNEITLQSKELPYLLQDDVEATQGALYRKNPDGSILLNGKTYVSGSSTAEGEKYSGNRHLLVNYSGSGDSLTIQAVP